MQWFHETRRAAVTNAGVINTELSDWYFSFMDIFVISSQGSAQRFGAKTLYRAIKGKYTYPVIFMQLWKNCSRGELPDCTGEKNA